MISETNKKGRADMTILLLTMMIVTETAFLVAEFKGSSGKNEWDRKRLIIDLVELSLFGVMLLLPDIDLSFRFTGLIITLIVRLVFAVLRYLFGRKSQKQKYKSGKIVSFILSGMMLTFALVPAFLFKNYKGRPLTGEYTPATCTAILTDASRTEQFEQDGSCREVPVYIFYPSEAEQIPDHSLPLVIFSHGAFGWYLFRELLYISL